MNIPQQPNIFWRRVLPNFWIKTGGGQPTAPRKELLFEREPLKSKQPLRMNITEAIESGFFPNSKTAVRALRSLRAAGLIPNFGEQGM